MTVDELRALRRAKSDYHLSKLLGVSKQLVSKWRKRGWVPAARAADATETTTHDTEKENAQPTGA